MIFWLTLVSYQFCTRFSNCSVAVISNHSAQGDKELLMICPAWWYDWWLFCFLGVRRVIRERLSETLNVIICLCEGGKNVRWRRTFSASEQARLRSRRILLKTFTNQLWLTSSVQNFAKWRYQPVIFHAMVWTCNNIVSKNRISI